jgi:predicted signal transduction protein with EAL and GGDEF domain
MYPWDGTSFEELYRRADRALYGAKNAGRSRFVRFHDLEATSRGQAVRMGSCDHRDAPPDGSEPAGSGPSPS